jgi:hypothetical protein
MRLDPVLYASRQEQAVVWRSANREDGFRKITMDDDRLRQTVPDVEENELGRANWDAVIGGKGAAWPRYCKCRRSSTVAAIVAHVKTL